MPSPRGIAAAFAAGTAASCCFDAPWLLGGLSCSGVRTRSRDVSTRGHTGMLPRARRGTRCLHSARCIQEARRRPPVPITDPQYPQYPQYPQRTAAVSERRPTRYTDRDAVVQSEPARASPPAFARKRCSHTRSTARRFRPLVMCEAEKAGGSARGYHSCTLERTSRARADAYSCSWAPRTTRRTCDAKYSTHSMPLAQSRQADRLDLPAVGFRRSWVRWDCRCSRSGCCSRGSGNGRRGGPNRR